MISLFAFALEFSLVLLLSYLEHTLELKGCIGNNKSSVDGFWHDMDDSARML